MFDSVELIIHKALPDLTSYEIFELKALFETQGVRKVEDLDELRETYFQDVIPVIQARKLITYLQRNIPSSHNSSIGMCFYFAL